MTTYRQNNQTIHESIDYLKERRKTVLNHDDPSTKKQWEKGKLTVRERIDMLFDSGTFRELEMFRRHRAQTFGLEKKRPDTDGVVTGYGKIEGRLVFAYGQDFRHFGGSLGEAHAQKVHKLMDMAIKTGAPLISINDGAGARIQEGVTGLAGYGGIFRRNSHASGRIPQLSLMLGPCAGGAAYSPALTDFVFMVRRSSQMFITGPDVVNSVTGADVDAEGLGGATVHTEVSGVADRAYNDEAACLEDARYLLSFLPQNSGESPPVYRNDDPINRKNDVLIDLVPSNPAMSYDIKDVIEEIVDNGDFFEIRGEWAKSLVTCFARLDGRTVGIIANNPSVRAGVLDIDSSQKGASFVQFCDAYNIPLITLVDVPGFMPGVEQEYGGIIRHGAKLLYAYCKATVPRISLVLRKAYGGAYIVMDSRSIGADVTLAWPSNEIAVMGPEAAARVVFRKEILSSDDPAQEEKRLAQHYRQELMHPYYGAERGLIDDVIDPAETREALVAALGALPNRVNPLSTKHGNHPQ